MLYPDDLTGKTIRVVTTRSMAARDMFSDWHTWTATTLTFTDDTSVTFAEDNTETFSDPFEYADVDDDGTPIPATRED